MTEHKDAVIGVTISDGQTNRKWGGYRVDYNDERDFAELAREDGAITDEETLTDVVPSSLSNPPADSNYHTTKSGYLRKVVVEYEGEDGDGNRMTADRDTLTGILDSLGINYVTEDVYPKAKERHVIRREDARNVAEVEEAIKTKAQLLDRALVEDSTREPIANAILTIQSNDQDLGGALDSVYEVMTGETAQETVDRLAPQQ